MKKLLQALNDYRAREYDDAPMNWGQFIDTLLLNRGLLYIAYTEDDNGAPMQMAYDVKRCEYVHMYNGEEKARETASLETFANDLEICEFDDFVRDLWQYAED